MLTSQSNQEFADARQRAFIEEWLSFFMGRPNDLLSFEEVRKNLRLQDSAYKGLQEIELDRIVGSVGRYQDFTRTFLPKSDATEQRWRQVDGVVHEQGLPPIEVYKVGDVYFVRDGNHRVSVARMHKSETIEAYVIEYKTSIPIDNQDDMDSILLKADQAEFLEETHLDKIRPDQDLRFTEPGRYRLVKEHIAFHKYLKELEDGRKISYDEAVGSWYDNVYLPVVQLIRERGVLKYFPGRTEADLYAWLVLHRATIEAEIRALGYVPNEDLIEELRRERASNPLARLVHIFHRKLDLQSLSLKAERAKFLEETQLDEIRPEYEVNFTESGCYKLAKEHIAVHKYLKEIEQNREISYQEAVGSWYDNVYLPVVQLIRDRQALRHCPDHSEADLYIWLVARRAELEEENQALGQIQDEKIIEDLERESQINPITRLTYFLSQKLHLQRMLVT